MNDASESSLKKCFYCAEEIRAEAKKCKHCGEFCGDIEEDIGEVRNSTTPASQDLITREPSTPDGSGALPALDFTDSFTSVGVRRAILVAASFLVLALVIIWLLDRAEGTKRRTLVAAAPSTPVKVSVTSDSRINRITSLVGREKQIVVQTLGEPTDFVYLTGMYTYKRSDHLIFMKFYDPERSTWAEQFGRSTSRGAAATLSSLILRFDWKPPVAVVLKSVNAPEKPLYMRLSKSNLAWYLNNLPNHRHYIVAFGGVQDAGYAYEVFADCSVPPLTGTRSFNYQKNHSEIAMLTPNSTFDWSGCTPTSLRMHAGPDFAGYSLSSYDPNLGSHDTERLALDGSELRPVTTETAATDTSATALVESEGNTNGGTFTVAGVEHFARFSDGPTSDDATQAIRRIVEDQIAAGVTDVTIDEVNREIDSNGHTSFRFFVTTSHPTHGYIPFSGTAAKDENNEWQFGTNDGT